MKDIAESAQFMRVKMNSMGYPDRPKFNMEPVGAERVQGFLECQLLNVQL